MARYSKFSSIIMLMALSRACDETAMLPSAPAFPESYFQPAACILQGENAVNCNATQNIQNINQEAQNVLELLAQKAKEEQKKGAIYQGTSECAKKQVIDGQMALANAQRHANELSRMAEVANRNMNELQERTVVANINAARYKQEADSHFQKANETQQQLIEVAKAQKGIQSIMNGFQTIPCAVAQVNAPYCVSREQEVQVPVPRVVYSTAPSVFEPVATSCATSVPPTPTFETTSSVPCVTGVSSGTLVEAPCVAVPSKVEGGVQGITPCFTSGSSNNLSSSLTTTNSCNNTVAVSTESGSNNGNCGSSSPVQQIPSGFSLSSILSKCLPNMEKNVFAPLMTRGTAIIMGGSIKAPAYGPVPLYQDSCQARRSEMPPAIPCA